MYCKLKKIFDYLSIYKKNQKLILFMFLHFKSLMFFIHNLYFKCCSHKYSVWYTGQAFNDTITINASLFMPIFGLVLIQVAQIN